MKQRLMFIDVESRSPVDLVACGAYKYWKDLRTEAYLMCYGFSDNPGFISVWTKGMDCPKEIFEHLVNKQPIVAHNAEFELLALQYYFTRILDWPFVTEDQMLCTSALARAHGLPGSLARAAQCMKLDTQKDMGGHQLMLKVCKPKGVSKDGTFIYEPLTEKTLQKLIDYCSLDVLTMIKLLSRLSYWTHELQDLWACSTRINQRGIQIDTQFAAAAVYASKTAKDTSNAKIDAFTLGDLHSVSQTVALKFWINKESDLALANVGAQTLEAIAEDDVPPHVWQVIRARLEGRAAASAKFKSALQGADNKDRLRGAYLPNGAATTGRFSSSRLQTHNMRRDTPNAEALEELRDVVVAGKFKGSLDTLASSVRGLIIPAPGNVLVKADWSQIEARIAPWFIADEDPTAKALLNIFERGGDVYEFVAADKFNKDLKNVSEEERFQGKVAQLSLAYGGGWVALSNMAAAYGKAFEETVSRKLVRGWRQSNTWALKLWAQLEHAAFLATAKNCEKNSLYVKLNDQPFLTTRLPSGRMLYYPFPKLELAECGDPKLTYKKAARSPKKDETKWPRTELYGGLLLANRTQAVAADLLRGALCLCDKLELPVVAHTHDDIVLEIPEDEAEMAKILLTKVMERAPEWATGLPLKAKTEILTRYR